MWLTSIHYVRSYYDGYQTTRPGWIDREEEEAKNLLIRLRDENYFLIFES